MNRLKNVDFNLFKAKLKVNNQAELISILSKEIAAKCSIEEQEIHALICDRFSQRTFSVCDDVILFDMTTTLITEPVMAMMTFENTVQFDSIEYVPSCIMAAVISPETDIPAHLQRLAATSRILRDEKLRKFLQEADNEEVLEMILMPRYKWATAA
ncbi:MAG: hypothetical protein GC137_08290 [Alphaproteobacteria bacterium]|nr:hypothetical protein [Alphaproteobacteria bacterium]